MLNWRPAFATNDALVDYLRDEVGLADPIVTAMKAVDRAHFVVPCGGGESTAYVDAPMAIGHDQTISAPHMHAMALQLLYPNLGPKSHILDVGSGSGILCAYLAELVNLTPESEGMVVGIESVQSLHERGIENVAKHKPSLLKNPRFKLDEGDGWVGYPMFAPYDAIHVGAAAAGLPFALLDQLSVGGVMILPYEAESGSQTLVSIKRLSEDSAGKVSATVLDRLEKEMTDGIARNGPFKVAVPGCGEYRVIPTASVAFVPLVKSASSGGSGC